MPRPVLRTAVAVAVLIVATAVLVVRRDDPGPPLGAVLDGDDRRALGAVPLRRGADPPPADPAVDLADPAAVARAYLALARSSTAADHGRTRREASPYAVPGSPAAVGLVVLDPPEPGQVRRVTVTALDLVAAADDDRRRGFRATVTTSTGPPGGVGTTAVTTEYVVLARQPDGRWLVVADAPELLEGGETDSTTTAAATLDWGEPTRTDEFDAGTEQWSLYDGPGHAGKGRRSPSAIAVREGLLTITGDSSGTTGGMSWGDGRRYGRWEARVRAPAADPSYNALLLLWPDAENWPEGGEIDFMEIGDADRQEVDVFLHYGEDNDQKHGRVETDATQWHHWAVEWTPTSITTFLDGRQWYRTTDSVVQPPGPMHLCIQLDWFPGGDAVRESTMEVDWVREYAVDSVE